MPRHRGRQNYNSDDATLMLCYACPCLMKKSRACWNHRKQGICKSSALLSHERLIHNGDAQSIKELLGRAKTRQDTLDALVRELSCRSLAHSRVILGRQTRTETGEAYPRCGRWRGGGYGCTTAWSFQEWTRKANPSGAVQIKLSGSTMSASTRTRETP